MSVSVIPTTYGETTVYEGRAPIAGSIPAAFTMELDYENLPCAIHDKIEPHQDGSIWCPECWHTYWDDADLIATELTEWASQYESRPAPTVDSISCCPLCLHDW